MQKEHFLPPDTHTQEMFTFRKVWAAVLRFALLPYCRRNIWHSLRFYKFLKQFMLSHFRVLLNPFFFIIIWKKKFSLFLLEITTLRAVKMYLDNKMILLVIRQKGESQNVCFKKTKHVKFSEKRTFFTRWYRVVRNVEMFVFRKIWPTLFSWNTRFEIHTFALLPTIFEVFFSKHLARIAALNSVKLLTMNACFCMCRVTQINYHNYCNYHSCFWIITASFGSFLILSKWRHLHCLAECFRGQNGNGSNLGILNPYISS